MPGWYEDLRRIVLMRINREPVPREMARGLLKAVVDDFDCPTDAHGGRWNGRAWHHGLTARPADAARIEALDRCLPVADGDLRLITRGDVFASCDSNTLFLAAMAWGYGLTGYGLHRTLKILDACRGDDAVVRAIEELRRSADPEAIWRAFSAGGRAKLPGLGTAFASKIAYFACYDRDTDKGPLIADLNSAWGFWTVEDVWDIRKSAALYAQYVETAVAWAHDLSVRSDDIERALFVIGPHARKIWRHITGLDGHT